MGLKGIVKDHRVYIDSNLFIYAVEKHPDFSSVVMELFQCIDNGIVEAITSELTLAEILV